MRKFLIACLLFSIVSLISTWSPDGTCDCSYRRKFWYGGGGCIITKAAPKFTACKCSYAGWTCTGKVINCDWQTPHGACKTPDTTKKSCEQGRGDCGGY
jgi:hypothetical protein